MTQINAYIRFNGNCREAMTFYKECLGGELTMQTVEGTPIEEHMPASARKNILHSTLVKDNLVLLGSDMTGPEGLQRGNGISLCLDCNSEEEIHSYYERLSAGGLATHPLEDAFWGGKFGDLVDKFGNSWLLNYSIPQ